MWTLRENWLRAHKRNPRGRDLAVASYLLLFKKEKEKPKKGEEKEKERKEKTAASNLQLIRVHQKVLRADVLNAHGKISAAAKSLLLLRLRHKLLKACGLIAS